ncbi:MAG: OB-fold nucleic acid binding domain-containing protein [Xanthobacteraceae bacterium]
MREAAPGRVRLAACMLYRGNDRARLGERAALAQKTGVPLIAVNDVLYHHPDRRELQDVLTCIREHLTIDTAGRRLAVNAERFLKSPDEMARIFAQAPEAVAETLALDRALTFSLDELKYEYPDETVAGFASPQKALEHLTWQGARERYPEGIDDEVRQSLANEFALIATCNYAPYFLTVYDIVRYARSQDILCQGRGSAANSTVCYCLGITSVDPVRGGLLFERFISAERHEPPDIDVDFEHERREEVIQYIYSKYGRDRAGIAGTVISYRGRSAIREVGKAFGLSEDTIGALASSIWGMGGGAVRESEFARAGIDIASPRILKMRALVEEIQSFPRHLSQHVGGFVMTRSRLDEVVPVMNGAMDDRTHVEWDKDDLDALGILKVDVLGLGMLTCIRKAFDLVAQHYGDVLAAREQHNNWSGNDETARLESLPPLSPSSPPPLRGRSDREAIREGDNDALRICEHPPPHPSPSRGEEADRACEKSVEHIAQIKRLTLATVPAEEAAVYRMLCRADSLGVFQVESRAQMSMLPRLRPDTFYDLVIEVAIVRPGPIQGDMVHPYLRRRQGLEKVSYPSKALEAVLGKTLGVPLFQEQAMKIAIVAGGFTPGEADQLRRAMATFKRTGTIGTFKTKMIEGMVGNGYPRDFAERCFKQIEGFGEYGFPESHAASFALLVYASAWLKCRYPDAFAAALLNAQPMGFYAPAQIVRDVREHGVEVRPVDINHSEWDATLEEGPRAATRLHDLHREMADDIRTTHALRLGLRQIKGLREDDAMLIHQSVPYSSVRDLWLRTGLSPRVIARLADADAFGSLGLTRRQALWAAKALGRVGDKDDDLPLFRASEDSATKLFDDARTVPQRSLPPCGEGTGRGVATNTGLANTPLPTPPPQGGREQSGARGNTSVSNQEPHITLPAMAPGEEVVNDYRFLQLTLRAHPASFLRADLDRRGIVRNATLRERRTGERVAVSGLVTIRQRPGTAQGVIFMTIEDETGIANIIVWPKTFERFRPLVLGARYIAVTGEMQKESNVIHVVAHRLDDLTPLLARLTQDLPPIESLARADAVKRPHDENVDRRARGRRNPAQIAAPLLDTLASDLDVPARGTAHAPSRRGGSKPPRDNQT